MSAALLAALAHAVTSTTLLWRLERPDGVALGFASHDREIRKGGLVYSAATGASFSAIVARSELEDDGIAFTGPLTAHGVSARDIEAGLWDYSRVFVDLCDWSQPDLGIIRLFQGRVTSLAVKGGVVGRFELEARRELVLRGNRGPLRCAPMCRAELGDRRCGIDMAGRQLFSTVASVDASMLAIVDPVADPERFVHGGIRVLTGPMAGFSARIVAVDGARFQLDCSLGNWAVGARVRLMEGCDKRFATCSGRFGNAAAFDGEPHMPGRDTLVRYGAP